MGLHLTEAGMPLIIKNDQIGMRSAASLLEHAKGISAKSPGAKPDPFLFQLTLDFPPAFETTATS
jgi:hypothetical protein